jgi:glutathione synthase/RimK-type ligase-like ATP-grasp enzyme
LISTLGGMIDWDTIKRWRLATLVWPRLLPFVAPWRANTPIRDDSAELGVAPPLTVRWPATVRRPFVGLVQDRNDNPNWTKYQRFLQNNQFPFRVVDIHSRSWMEMLAGIDMIVWAPGSSPAELDEARRKIFYLNEFLGIKTYPTVRSINLYEDKILQSWVLARLGFDTPPTVTSFSREDALEGLKELGDEVVWKITTGSASYGVELLSARQARAATRRAFSARGRSTYWPYLNQKDYVYAQPLQRDLRTDMRIMVIGPLLFGFYRDAPPKDFRASGMRRERKQALPYDALEDAWRISRELDVGAVAVDSLVDQDFTQRRIIELSSFTGVLTQDQLQVDGRPGVYIRRSAGSFEFHEGQYWVQELALAEALARACGLDVDQLLLDSILAR